MQFYVFVVVPSNTEDVVATVTRLMEPYELYREVPLHKEFVPEHEIQEVVTTFGVDAGDLEAVMAGLRDESGFECGIESGRIYWMTTDNPQGQWDSWRLRSLRDDVWPVSVIPKDHVPSAIVTPDGVWHDLGDKWNMAEDEKIDVWKKAEALLEQYASCLGVMLYCHR